MIPFDVNAEKGALGCCVLGAYSEAVAAGVDDTWFNELKHKALWLLLGQLSDKGDFTETEVVMATQKLEELTPADILEASDAAPTAANFSYWLKPLREQKRRREYYNLASDVQQRVAREELDPFVDEVETRLFDLRKLKQETDANARAESFVRVQDMMLEAHNGRGIMGLRTGYEEMDKVLCGLRGGQLITIAARTSVGKTTLAMNLAEYLVMAEEVPVVFFSLEMATDELNTRMLSSYIGVNMQSFINHDYDEQQRLAIINQAAKAIPTLNAAPLTINSRTDITISQIRAEARRLVKNRGVKAVIVDYLQLVKPSGRGGNRVQDVGEISRGLKRMALELDVPVIALAQLNGQVENENRAPRLADLRESGSIEADSDVVMMIYAEDDTMKIDGRKLCQIGVLKNRAGCQAKFDIVFNRDVAKFESCDKHPDLISLAEDIVMKKTKPKGGRSAWRSAKL